MSPVCAEQETLPGFKWIGNRIQELSETGHSIIFAFEESIGNYTRIYVVYYMRATPQAPALPCVQVSCVGVWSRRKMASAPQQLWLNWLLTSTTRTWV